MHVPVFFKFKFCNGLGKYHVTNVYIKLKRCLSGHGTDG